MVSSAADGASVTSPRSATVTAAAMATAVMIDRVASSIRRSSGGRYMRFVESSAITRAAKTNVQATGNGVAPDMRCARKSATASAAPSVTSEIRPQDAKRLGRRARQAFRPGRCERAAGRFLSLDSAHGLSLDSAQGRPTNPRGARASPPVVESELHRTCATAVGWSTRDGPATSRKLGRARQSRLARPTRSWASKGPTHCSPLRIAASPYARRKQNFRSFRSFPWGAYQSTRSESRDQPPCRRAVTKRGPAPGRSVRIAAARGRLPSDRLVTPDQPS